MSSRDGNIEVTKRLFISADKMEKTSEVREHEGAFQQQVPSSHVRCHVFLVSSGLSYDR